MCQWGLATVRTDPDAPKHAGVTMMAIDMNAAGVTVNPLRGITGARALQRGVLRRRVRPRRRRRRRREQGLAGGARHAGQRAHLDRRWLRRDRRITADDLIKLLDSAARRDGGHACGGRARSSPRRTRCGCSICAARPARSRAPSRARGQRDQVAGRRVRPALHRVGTRAGRARRGGRADTPTLTASYLGNRAMTIAGGTSEITRNTIAERILGLPRDPLLR